MRDFVATDQGPAIPDEIQKTIVSIDVPYKDFDGKSQTGTIEIHRELAEDISEIFNSLHKLEFPFTEVAPISTYGWDDEISMTANNTSAFNYRRILVHEIECISNHARGRAIDINPLLNPWISSSGRVQPASGIYRPGTPGTITSDMPIVSLFKERGWVWGGEWKEPIDYQHFEKPA